MALGSCYSCIKYLMFAFNFLFWLLGCAILGVGIWILVDEKFGEYVDGDPEFGFLHTGAYVLIVVGVIIMVISFLGCCGAIKENRCMLAVFFAFLFIIFVALLGVGIWAVVQKDELMSIVSRVLENKVTAACEENNKQARNFMSSIQKTFECCGANKLEDYVAKCIKDPIDPCAASVIGKSGCTQKLYEFMSDKILIVAGVAIGIAVILILGMIFSMVLCCAIRDINQ